MRIISQDKSYDAPYDSMILEVVGCNITIGPKDSACNKRVIGTYSTKEKAFNVMEMVRGEYESIQESNFLRCENAYYVRHVFYIPQDSEVEA